MFNISKETGERLREQYPAGARVELLHMEDPYNTKLVPGSKGTVLTVDDLGTIHVRWDCGSSLGVAYGEDSCKVIEQEQPEVPEMERFYFTYGTDPAYPFRGGWTLIIAPDEGIAAQIFRAFHPDRPGHYCLNCADYYHADYFEQSLSYKTGNFGAYCHEVIEVKHTITKDNERGQA